MTQLDILSDSCLVVNQMDLLNICCCKITHLKIHPRTTSNYHEYTRFFSPTTILCSIFPKKNRQSKFSRRHKILQIRSWCEGHLGDSLGENHISCHIEVYIFHLYYLLLKYWMNHDFLKAKYSSEYIIGWLHIKRVSVKSCYPTGLI